jgi:hypothetical protein
MDAWPLCKVVPYQVYRVPGLFPQLYTENVDSKETSRRNPQPVLLVCTTSNLQVDAQTAEGLRFVLDRLNLFD